MNGGSALSNVATLRAARRGVLAKEAVYGPDLASTLAVWEPGKAVMNANSYEYFSENDIGLPWPFTYGIFLWIQSQTF